MTGEELDRAKQSGCEAEPGLSRLIDAALSDVEREQSEAIAKLSAELKAREVAAGPAPAPGVSPAPEPPPTPEGAFAPAGDSLAEEPTLAPITRFVATPAAVAATPAPPSTAEPVVEPPVFVAVGADEPARSRRWLLVVAVIVLAAIVLGWLIFGAHAANPFADSARVGATAVATLSAPVESAAVVVATVAGSRQTATSLPSPSPLPPSVNAAGASPAAVVSSATPPAPLSGFARKAASFIASARTGEMAISYDYGGGTTATANLLFDLGDAAHPARLRLSTTYKSPQGSRESDTLLVGDRAWESQDGRNWTETAPRAGVWDQLQSYLPKIPPPENVVARSDGGGVQLLWLEGSSDVTLVVDQATSTPIQLQKSDQVTHARLVVEYLHWNTPVDIAGA